MQVGLVASKVAMGREQREHEQNPRFDREAWVDMSGIASILFVVFVLGLTATCCCVLKRCGERMRSRAARQTSPSMRLIDADSKGTPVVVIAQESVPFGVEVKEVAA